MFLRILPLFCLISSLCLSCQDASITTATSLPSPVLPEEQWLRRSPAELGVDSAILEASLAYLASHCKDNGLEEVMIIRNGYLIWAGDSIDKVHDIWSCTKSFVSAAAGLLAAEGTLDLDEPLASYASLLEEYYPTATARHFLTMTSGYNAVGQSRWNEPSEDWSLTPYQPDTPLFNPGTAYAYWDEAMIMFGRVLTKIAGQSLNDYLNQRLFNPIGITQPSWWGEGKVLAPTDTSTNSEPIDINFGGTGIKMSASQQARFGLLMLNQGRWGGQQLLPQQYVVDATKNQVSPHIKLADTDRKSTDGRGIYGYNWWVINEGIDAPVAAAFTSGLNHNVCLIIPAWNMVIVRQGVDGNPTNSKHQVYSELLKKLAAAIK